MYHQLREGGAPLPRRRWFHRLLRRDIPTSVQIQVPCEFLGTRYGGYCLCPEGIGPRSVFYSFGAGEDISFDLAMAERFGLEVHIFDPTPRAIAWLESQSLPPAFRIHPYGLADFDGKTLFYPPRKKANISHSILERPRTADRAVKVEFRRLGTIMEELGHQRVDVLKMDIEGAEYSVLRDILGSSIAAAQILVEFHHHFDNIDISETRQIVDQLNLAGYRIFYISGSGHEYSFLGPSPA
jgi:FkbM family methyltransferase